MKTDILVHCGNAPKMEQAINLSVAFAKRDFGLVKTYVREDFIWLVVGSDKTIRYDELNEKLPRQPEVKSLTVRNAMSHGRSAMCEGELFFADGESLLFCTVVEFVNTAKNALISSAHTYLVGAKGFADTDKASARV